MPRPKKSRRRHTPFTVWLVPATLRLVVVPLGSSAVPGFGTNTSAKRTLAATM